MDKQHNTLNRRSIRLRGYDYSQPGSYLVTICTQNRSCLFGEINEGLMRISHLGSVVAYCLEEIPVHFPNCSLDFHTIMPNHFHGIFTLEGSPSVRPVGAGLSRPYVFKPRTLGHIIGYFKYQSTKNDVRRTPGAPVWQRNYYEHIIRNEDDLNEIREYIETNPAKWLDDENHPENITAKQGAGKPRPYK